MNLNIGQFWKAGHSFRTFQCENSETTCKMADIFKVLILGCFINLIVLISTDKMAMITNMTSNVSKECYMKIIKNMQYCKKNSVKKWNSRHIKISQDKSFCCFTWDMIDCLERFIKVRIILNLSHYFQMKLSCQHNIC